MENLSVLKRIARLYGIKHTVSGKPKSFEQLKKNIEQVQSSNNANPWASFNPKAIEQYTKYDLIAFAKQYDISVYNKGKVKTKGELVKSLRNAYRNKGPVRASGNVIRVFDNPALKDERAFMDRQLQNLHTQHKMLKEECDRKNAIIREQEQLIAILENARGEEGFAGDCGCS